METVDLGGGAHVLRGAVNSGLVETENGLLAVDTGYLTDAHTALAIHLQVT